MTLKDKRKWKRKLRKYWKLWLTMHDEWRKNEGQLEDMMKKETGKELEFIYGDMDMGCIGIGHIDDGGRKDFPLFQAGDLGGY